jgi:hypothetical protein
VSGRGIGGLSSTQGDHLGTKPSVRRQHSVVAIPVLGEDPVEDHDVVVEVGTMVNL